MTAAAILGDMARVQLWGYRCERCSHAWVPRGSETPRVCPRCKSPYWDRPRQSRSPNPESEAGSHSRLPRDRATHPRRLPGVTTFVINAVSRIEAVRDGLSRIGYSADNIESEYLFTVRNGHAKTYRADLVAFADTKKHDLETA